MNDTKPFRIMSKYVSLPTRKHLDASVIPWWLAEEAYEYYKEAFGDKQSLEEINACGGFGRNELLWLLRKEKI